MANLFLNPRRQLTWTFAPFVANVAATLEQLDKIITSEFDSNPPLYITRRKVNGKEEIYINNARVIRSRSNKIGHNVKGKRTVRRAWRWRMCFSFNWLVIISHLRAAGVVVHKRTIYFNYTKHRLFCYLNRKSSINYDECQLVTWMSDRRFSLLPPSFIPSTW